MCGPTLFPTLIDTDHSLALQDIALQDMFNLQYAALANGLSYDCPVFDKSNTCLAGGAHFTDVGSNSSSGAGGSLIGAYHVTNNLRLGGYLDQSVSSKNITGVDLRNDSPMLGLFGAWSQNPDGRGFEARISSGYEANDMTTTRVVPSFFGGNNVGDTRLFTRGVSATVSYGVPFNGQWIATPYLGFLGTDISRAGYTENSSNPFSSQLTYNTLTDRQSTAVVGLRLRARVAPRVTLMGSAGLEHDISHSAGLNTGSGVFGTVGPATAPGTASANFGATYRQTRGVMSVGSAFDVRPGQQIVAALGYQQNTFQANNTATGTVAYQVGF